MLTCLFLTTNAIITSLVRSWASISSRSRSGATRAPSTHTERGRNEVNSIKENLISEIKLRAEQVYGGGGPFVCSTANRPDLHVIRSASVHSANSSFVFRDSTAFGSFHLWNFGACFFFQVTLEVAHLAKASAAATLGSVTNEERSAKITFRIVKTSCGQLCQLHSVRLTNSCNILWIFIG